MGFEKVLREVFVRILPSKSKKKYVGYAQGNKLKLNTLSSVTLLGVEIKLH